MKLDILGIDPSFRHTGTALCTVDVDTLEITPRRLRLIEVGRDDSKGVKRGDDDYRCARALTLAVREEAIEASIVISEATFFSKSATASKGGGICLGLLAGIDQQLIRVEQREAKLASTGNLKAEKAETLAWAVARWPDLPWKRRKLRGQMVLDSDNEHLADALAVICAGVKKREFQAIVDLWRPYGRAMPQISAA